MKHLKKYNYFSINENWISDAQEGLTYDRTSDIRSYFLELLDLNFEEEPVELSICDDEFTVKDRMIYVNKDLYQSYKFRWTTRRIHNMNTITEIMDTISEAVQRLRDSGYSFRIMDLTLGKNHRVKIFEVIFYHSDDKIGFERIFIPKGDR
jgi:hypothetical protein